MQEKSVHSITDIYHIRHPHIICQKVIKDWGAHCSLCSSFFCQAIRPLCTKGNWLTIHTHALHFLSISLPKCPYCTVLVMFSRLLTCTLCSPVLFLCVWHIQPHGPPLLCCNVRSGLELGCVSLNVIGWCTYLPCASSKNLIRLERKKNMAFTLCNICVLCESTQNQNSTSKYIDAQINCTRKTCSVCSDL